MNHTSLYYSDIIELFGTPTDQYFIDNTIHSYECIWNLNNKIALLFEFSSANFCLAYLWWDIERQKNLSNEYVLENINSVSEHWNQKVLFNLDLFVNMKTID